MGPPSAAGKNPRASPLKVRRGIDAGQQNELFYLPLLYRRGMVVAILAQAILA